MSSDTQLRETDSSARIVLFFSFFFFLWYKLVPRLFYPVELYRGWITRILIVIQTFAIKIKLAGRMNRARKERVA